MPVGLAELPKLTPIVGVRWGIGQAGIKQVDRDDVAMMAIAEGGSCAAVYTQNAFCAAPVVVAREHGVEPAVVRYLLINSGNANAGTGKQGLLDARASCEAVARIANCNASQVLPFSTGVIGQPLAVSKIDAVLPAVFDNLNEDAWDKAARAIMTTDIVPKGASVVIDINGKPVTITGISKGSGMIHPNMATMLSYVATDAAVADDLLQDLLAETVKRTFNCITVDGDTSTNDACVLVATGASGVQITDEDEPALVVFQVALTHVMEKLAQAIVRDGEGATKFITIDVIDGKDEQECRQVAETIAHSPLVKTAFFASDPNWGRILAAVGRAGLDSLDLGAISIHLGDVCIVRDGGRAPDYSEAAGQAVMDDEEITVTVNLGRGYAKVRVWTCDFSYDYVKINAEYRT